MSAFGPCPNGLCEHAAMHHDIYTYEDPRPSCCVDGCDCRYSDEELGDQFAADWFQGEEAP